MKEAFIGHKILTGKGKWYCDYVVIQLNLCGNLCVHICTDSSCQESSETVNVHRNACAATTWSVPVNTAFCYPAL